MDIIKKIAEELEVKTSQVDAAVKLIDYLPYLWQRQCKRAQCELAHKLLSAAYLMQR